MHASSLHCIAILNVWLTPQPLQLQENFSIENKNYLYNKVDVKIMARSCFQSQSLQERWIKHDYFYYLKLQHYFAEALHTETMVNFVQLTIWGGSHFMYALSVLEGIKSYKVPHLIWT